MARAARTSRCGTGDARVRLRAAEAYLQVAELVRDEANRAEFTTVAAGDAVLAGIAACDEICCCRLQRRARGDDHRAAARLVEQAVPDGKALASTLIRLLDIKDAAHYGVSLIDTRTASNATRWAKRLVDRAREEIER